MNKIYSIFMVLILCGCSVNKKQESLTLKVSRVQIKQDTSIDYLSYVCDNIDTQEVSYTNIDSHQLGTYQIEYKYHHEKHTLIVDIVKMYKNNIYSPIDIEPEIIKNPEDIAALVNKTHQIPIDWEPSDLVEVIDSHQKLRKEAADAYRKFYEETKKRGIACYAISGYRDYKTQSLYWSRQVNIKGEEYASQFSAYPARSEHQLGLAIDVSYQLTGDRLSNKVENSDIGRFIISDGYKYGFILRYPKDKITITNYGYEPWHMRYVGVDLATKLHQKNLTLEEYYEQVNKI